MDYCCNGSGEMVVEVVKESRETDTVTAYAKRMSAETENKEDMTIKGKQSIRDRLK